MSKEAIQYINATLAAFGPDEAISMTKETWSKLREAMKALAKPDFWEGYVPEPVKPARQEPVFSYTPDMDAVRRAEKEKADKFLAHLAQQALDKMAENARELGLDYEPSTGMQVSKVWWDSEKLMAKPIPFVEFYKPAQRTWVGLTRKEVHDLYDSDYAVFHQRIEAKLKEKNT